MIDFIRYKNLGLGFFVVLFFIFGAAYFYKQTVRGSGFLYSIDFTGGTQAHIRVSRAVTGADIAQALSQSGFPDAIIREFSATEYVVRVREISEDVGGVAERIRTALESNISDLTVELRQIDSVGSSIGASLWWSCMRAVVVCLLAILIYMLLIRFMPLGFALGAVGSLFHDALLMLTFCVIADFEISVQTITAILLVLGYSINDTIIIFSRVRENMIKMRSVSLEAIVNISINETLRRTILTVLSTILVVIPILLFGGEALRTLSSMLLVGFIFGTYSSIYVASPIMLFFTHKAYAQLRK